MGTTKKSGQELFKILTYFKSLVRVPNNTDKGAQYDIDEQRDKCIYVYLAKHPYGDASMAHFGKCWVHIVPVQQREQTFCRCQKCLKLKEKQMCSHEETYQEED